MKAEELTKKREEAERKARRGEIDPTHEFTFHLIGQVETLDTLVKHYVLLLQFSGLLRHEIMDFMFNDPAMLDDLDFLYKSDNARKILFYYQPEEGVPVPLEQKNEPPSTELVRYKDKPRK